MKDIKVVLLLGAHQNAGSRASPKDTKSELLRWSLGNCILG